MKAYLIKTVMAATEFLGRLFILNRNLGEGWLEVKNKSYAPGRKRKMDIYMPSLCSGFCPVVIYLHGGGWTTGSKLTCKRQAVTMARKGYVVLNINYRLGPAHRHPSQIEDIGRAVRWLRINAADYGGDVKRIFLAGESAGAHLACLSACIAKNKELEGEMGLDFPLQAENVAGLILFYGAYDMESLVESGFFMIKTMVRSYLGGDPAKSAAAREASPVFHITEDFPPVFLSAGGADPLFGQTLQLAKEFERKGVVFESLLFDVNDRKGGHSYLAFHHRKNAKEAYRRISRFLKKHS